MGSSGGVAITAGFVFAITMLALLSSDVVNRLFADEGVEVVGASLPG
jgi:small neutral amino acid transporter SnatA (MarC family)